MRNATVRPVWFGAWMLCALLVTASVDNIPDPPAVKSPAVEVGARGFSSQLATSTPEDLKCHSFRSGPQFAARWVTLRRVLEPRIPADRIALVRQAADPSPPKFLL
jgi:hypothetical protein